VKPGLRVIRRIVESSLVGADDCGVADREVDIAWADGLAEWVQVWSVWHGPFTGRGGTPEQADDPQEPG